MQTKYLASFISKVALKMGYQGPERDESGLNDLSYEDALLDVEIRSFMRAEYDKKVPPSGVFPRIMRAIRLHQLEQKRAAEAMSAGTGLAPKWGAVLKAWRQAFAAAYRIGAHPGIGRVMSGGLVTALLLLAVGPGVLHLRGSDDGLYNLYVRTLSGGGNLQQANFPATNSVAESPTASTLAVLETASSAPTPSADAAAVPSSRGTLYEDPRLVLAQRIGEDPAELQKHRRQIGVSGTHDDLNTNQNDPRYERPFAGPD